MDGWFRKDERESAVPSAIILRCWAQQWLDLQSRGQATRGSRIHSERWVTAPWSQTSRRRNWWLDPGWFQCGKRIMRKRGFCHCTRVLPHFKTIACTCGLYHWTVLITWTGTLVVKFVVPHSALRNTLYRCPPWSLTQACWDLCN